MIFAVFSEVNTGKITFAQEKTMIKHGHERKARKICSKARGADP
jgi:hypothetical protein